MSGQRTIAIGLLLVAGILSLPVASYSFDSPAPEILVHLVAMTLLGALVGRLLPGLAGTNQSGGRPMVVGAVVGVLMAVVGIVIFFPPTFRNLNRAARMAEQPFYMRGAPIGDRPPANAHRQDRARYPRTFRSSTEAWPGHESISKLRGEEAPNTP